MPTAPQRSGDNVWALINTSTRLLSGAKGKGSGRQKDGVSGMNGLINPAWRRRTQSSLSGEHILQRGHVRDGVDVASSQVDVIWFKNTGPMCHMLHDDRHAPTQLLACWR